MFTSYQQKGQQGGGGMYSGFGSEHNFQKPEGFLKQNKPIVYKKKVKKPIDKSQRQNREVENIGFAAAVKQSKMVQQLGGAAAAHKKSINTKKPKTKSVSKKSKVKTGRSNKTPTPQLTRW